MGRLEHIIQATRVPAESFSESWESVRVKPLCPSDSTARGRSAGKQTLCSTGANFSSSIFDEPHTHLPAKKKVLLVSKDIMHYRVPIYNYFNARFRELGYEYAVLTTHLQQQNQRRIDFELYQRPFQFATYRSAIAAYHPDVVILFVHLRHVANWLLMHWLKIRGTPFALWTKGANLDAKDSRFRQLPFTYSNRLSDALILYSKSCLRLLESGLQNKVFIASNTLNFQAFPQIEASKEEIKREFGIPFCKVVLFVGRMETEKGRKRVDYLIDTFADLNREDVGLVLVGSGLTEKLRSRMNRRNSIYLGEVHDANDIGISKLFKMADVFSIPGHLGLGLNQAFYWGLPVVTEDGNQPPEFTYLKPSWNGFVVEKNDRNAFRERLLFLLDNDSIRAEFGRNAQQGILAEASIEGMFQGFKACVDFLARCQPPNGAKNRKHELANL
jgi:glycosyltransferase involved in cell wall biosynthesis